MMMTLINSRLQMPGRKNGEQTYRTSVLKIGEKQLFFSTVVIFLRSGKSCFYNVTFVMKPPAT
jgi:hypothetical protein